MTIFIINITSFIQIYLMFQNNFNMPQTKLWYSESLVFHFLLMILQLSTYEYCAFSIPSTMYQMYSPLHSSK